MKILLIAGLISLFAFTSALSFGQCQADYNGDGVITVSDLNLFLGDYGLGQNCVQCDLNNDGNVTQQDVTLFQGYFGASCATIPPMCQADYNLDGIVSVSDIGPFNLDLSSGQNCVQCDLNGDGIVSYSDELVFQGVLGISCPITGCQGDYNNDGTINSGDLGPFLSDYSQGQNCVQCDMNNDGNVDEQDITTFQGLFGTSCSTIPTDCPADYNGDGIISVGDLPLFLNDYSLGQNCIQCDLNGDGIVGQNDVTLFEGLFGTYCVNGATGCPGDYNNDGLITAQDMGDFLADFGLGQNCAQCDINGNGIVDQQDNTLMQGLFGATCATIPTNCPADYNGDGSITASDFNLFILDYGDGANCVQCDLNGDGNVNQQDIQTFEGLFGTNCGGTEPSCVGDYNGDGVISAADFTLFQSDYALGNNCTQCDINGDGLVNDSDIKAFKAIFGTKCPQPNTCPDYNNDGIISAADLSLFLADYALGPNCVMCDINGDGVVGQQDVDFFVSVFGTTCGKTKSLATGEIELIAVDLLMYPNPANDVVNIMLNNGTEIQPESTLQVIDLRGRIIETFDISSKQGMISMNIDSFEPGTYFVSLTTSDKQYKAKLIVK